MHQNKQRKYALEELQAFEITIVEKLDKAHGELQSILEALGKKRRMALIQI